MKLPAPLQRLKDVWMAIGHAMGMVMSKILLTVLWLTVFGAYALIGRLIRLIRPGPRRGPQSTYWVNAKQGDDQLRYQF